MLAWPLGHLFNKCTYSVVCARLVRVSDIRTFHLSALCISKSTRKRQFIRDTTVYDIHSSETSKKKAVYAFGFSATGALGIKRLGLSTEIPGVYHPVRVTDFGKLHPLNVACGYGFSTYICKFGSNKFGIYGCGLNTDGQLGQQPSAVDSLLSTGETTKVVPTPTHISLNFNANEAKNLRPTHLACGRAHTLVALSWSSVLPESSQPVVLSFGSNSFGQCGREIITDENYCQDTAVISRIVLPTEIEGIKQIVCGQDHTLLLSSDGRVYSCGIGSDGQLGLGNFKSVDKFTVISDVLDKHKVSLLASRGDTVLALTDTNRLFAWGNNEYSQIWSHNSDMQIPIPIELDLGYCIVPPEANLDSNKVEIGKVVSIACAGSMCALVNEIGHVFVWGFGCIGLGPELNFTPKPTLIPPGLFLPATPGTTSKITSITSGLHHFIARNDQGLLWSWGAPRGGMYCLGLGNQRAKSDKKQSYPVPLQLPARAVDVACGVDHTIVLTKSLA